MAQLQPPQQADREAEQHRQDEQLNGAAAQNAPAQEPAESAAAAAADAAHLPAPKRPHLAAFGAYRVSRSHASHPWHDLEAGENPPDLINAGECAQPTGLLHRQLQPPRSPAHLGALLLWHAVIEIPRGSKVKYELDKKSGEQPESCRKLALPNGLHHESCMWLARPRTQQQRTMVPLQETCPCIHFVSCWGPPSLGLEEADPGAPLVLTSFDSWTVDS